MNLLIVIVNYNGSDLTIGCLRSLAPELEAMPTARVGVCDNGSEPEDVQRLADAIGQMGCRDRIELTAITPNQGFTGGNNVVIRAALGSAAPPDAVLLLNNDTLVQPGALAALVDFVGRRPDVGLCGSRLEYPDGESQHAARRVLTAASEFDAYARTGLVTRLLRRWIVTPRTETTTASPCGWVPGAALLIRREVLERVGLLDEGLYTYFDDVDYCLRARRAGWPTWFVPDSRIVHLVGKTTGVTSTSGRPRRRPEYWFWARRRYFRKNFGPAYAAVADLAAVSGLVFWKIRLWAQRRPDPDPPRLLYDLLRHSVLATGFRERPVANPLTGEPVVSAEAARRPTPCPPASPPPAPPAPTLSSKT